MKNNQTQFKETEIGLIPEDWEVLKIPDIANNFDNKRVPISSVKRAQIKGIYPYYGATGVLDYINDYKLDGDYLLIAEDGTVTVDGQHPMLQNVSGKFWVSNHAHILQCNDLIDQQYLYYQLSSTVVTPYVTGAVQLKLNQSNLNKIPLLWPKARLERQKIAEVLGALDDKIELIRKMNKTLESLGQTIFKRWFVDFEDKSDWIEFKLGSFFPIKTGKKDANFGTTNGGYPFFTCSQSNLKADNYSFDCSALLLSGNGEFSIKWYEGKFEAYQRTYVLEPYKKELLGFLFFLTKYFLNEITAGNRGSVIKFITKGMIEDFVLQLPPSTIIKEKSLIFDSIIKNIDSNKKEIETLSQIRDSLLPRLMSGKLRLK